MIKKYLMRNILAIASVIVLAGVLLYIGTRPVQKVITSLPEGFPTTLTVTPASFRFPFISSANAEEADSFSQNDNSIANDTAEDNSAEEDTAAESAKPAAGYVFVTLQSTSFWLPLPSEGEYSYPIVQQWSDGTTSTNILHVTPDGVFMESSTCDSQDCVHQGTVTLENKETRILWNMIICLPNQVVIELYTPEEILAMYQQSN